MSGEWSVIMTEWSGDWIEFDKTARKLFQADGIDTFSLTIFADHHLPAELRNGLSRRQADEVAVELTAVGATVEIRRTEEIGEVRRRVHEVWANRCADGICFSEVDGMISTLGSLNARMILARAKPDVPRWEVELSMNHCHVALGSRSLNEAIEAGERHLVSLEVALRNAYPDRAFTLEHDPPSTVSFWQTTPDSPRAGRPVTESADKPETVWCQRCGGMRRYASATEGHPLFPGAQWGKCSSCGDHVIVRGCAKLTFIEPSQARACNV